MTLTIAGCDPKKEHLLKWKTQKTVWFLVSHDLASTDKIWVYDFQHHRAWTTPSHGTRHWNVRFTSGSKTIKRWPWVPWALLENSHYTSKKNPLQNVSPSLTVKDGARTSTFVLYSFIHVTGGTLILMSGIPWASIRETLKIIGQMVDRH